jgi:hypothetical protein
MAVCIFIAAYIANYIKYHPYADISGYFQIFPAVKNLKFFRFRPSNPRPSCARPSRAGPYVGLLPSVGGRPLCFWAGVLGERES